MDAPLFIGVAIGVAAGALLGYVATESVVERIGRFGRVAIVRTCAIAAGVIAVVPVSFFAFVVGGNMGGGSAAYLLGEWAVAFGIGFGIAVAFSICMLCAATFGAAIGVIISRTLGKDRAA